MKTLAVIITSVSTVLFLTLYSVSPELIRTPISKPEKSCVFNSMMGIESTEDYAKHKTPEKVVRSIDDALTWMAKAQQKNGGWGAGSHSNQREMNPHAVQADASNYIYGGNGTFA